MNLPQRIEPTAMVEVKEGELELVLQNSLYPGASLPSIRMVMAYCRAAQLDPMQKPVHIVPMWDPKASQMRDVIMPGINLYRIQAARSGAFAGVSEPTFGPMVEQVIGGVKVSFPEWASVTVRRIMGNNHIAEFTAREFWIENYAEKGGKEKSVAPNKMWMKRTRGQIAKCAEAQALRKAFPEVGSAPTAEEMEGRTIADFGDVIEDTPTTPRGPQRKSEQRPPTDQPDEQGPREDAPANTESSGQPASGDSAPLPDYSADAFEKNLPAWSKLVADGKKSAPDLLAMLSTKATFSEEQKARVLSLKAYAPKAQEVDPFVADMEAEEQQ